MSVLPEPLWWLLIVLVGFNVVLFGLRGLLRAATWALDKWADAQERKGR